MSEPGPFDDDPFQGIPIFEDLARMLRQQQGGGLGWQTARQIAVSIATDWKPEPNVDPLERMKLEQLARVAELQVAAATGLETSRTGAALALVPRTRAQWVDDTLAVYRPLLEALAESLGGGATAQPADETDPATAWLGRLMTALGPMMLGMATGSMVGHLARRAFGQYDLPVPHADSDEISIVLPNLDEFGEEWSLDRDELRLWVCVNEIAHHAVLGVPHVRERLERQLREYASGFEPDPEALERRFGALDLDDAGGVAGLQAVLGDPEALLGAVQSRAQLALLPEIEALVAVVIGYVDHVMDRIGTTLIAGYTRVTEALRRRRVEVAPADRFVERLLGLDLRQAHYDRGAAFVAGVIERAGEEALALLWSDPDHLPTPSEVDAPGLWLARIGVLD